MDNLTDDPGETVNLFDVRPALAGKLGNRLSEIEESSASRETVPAKLGEKDRAVLESLGYVGGGGTTAAGPERLRDPKDYIHLRTEFIASVDLIHRGDTATAEAKLNGLIDASPESYVFRLRLGRLQYDEERLEDAGATFRELARLFPGEFRTHYNLGKTLNRLGNFREAIAELEQALAIDPAQTAGWNNLGIAFLRTGQIEEAIGVFDRSIELDGRQVDPHNNRGNALLALNRVREAETSFARAVEINPDFFEGRYNLGLTLLRLGRNRMAAAEFDHALRIRPDFLPARQYRDEALRRTVD